MLLQDVYSAEAVAYRLTEDVANRMPYVGEAFFPAKKKIGIDLKMIKGHKGVGVALKPSAFDALATIRPRQGFQMTATEMPLFRESMKVSEQDMIEIARAQDSNDPYVDEVLNNIYDDAANLVEGARIAAERMRMQLLAPQNGDVKISIGLADNITNTVNYDTDGSWKRDNYVALSSTDAWDQADATPLDDLQKMADAVAAKGFAAEYVLMNSKTFGYLKSNPQIKNAIISASGIAVAYVDNNTIKNIIKNTVGLTVILNDKTFVDYDGVSKKFYPDNYATIIGGGTTGNTWYGTTPEERTLMNDAKVDVALVEGGIAVAIQNIYGPPAQTSTTVSQITLPSFEGMDKVAVLKVK